MDYYLIIFKTKLRLREIFNLFVNNKCHLFSLQDAHFIETFDEKLLIWVKNNIIIKIKVEIDFSPIYVENYITHTQCGLNVIVYAF